MSFYKSIIHERYISLALIKLRAQLGNRGVGDVIVVVHHFIDDAIRRQLDDAVGDGLDELVVVAREEDIAFERLERVVERLDGFEVQVVRRRVEDEAVRVDQHHARNHATHFLASGEDAHLLQQLFAREKHAAEEALEEHLVRLRRELRKPLDEVIIRVEVGRIVEREVRRGDGLSPLVRTGVGLLFAVDDLEEGGHGARVVADEDNLVALFDIEVQVAEQRLAFDAFREALDFENLVARLAVRAEQDARVAARRGLDFLDIQLFEHLLAARGLL